jgi:tetratricopeptide (TPR) repeat protein
MKKKSAPPPPAAVVGYLDSIHDGCALGWAYAPNSPSENLTVTLSHGDRIVGQGLANIFREDLIAAGIGNGHHSFKIPLSYELGNGEDHEISARILGANLELNGSPKTASYNSKFDFSLISRKEGRLELEKISDTLIKLGKVRSGENLLKAFELASMLQETMKLKEASYGWDALKQSTGNQVLFICKQAEIFLLSGQYEEALKLYLEAAAIDLTSPWPHIGIINCHYLLKNYSESHGHTKSALELHPQNLTIGELFVKIDKLLTPPDPAENKFVQRFAHLGSLLSKSAAQKELHSIKNTDSSPHESKLGCESSLMNIDDAVKKIHELQHSIDEFHRLRVVTVNQNNL